MKIVAKYPGTCAACGNAFVAGVFVEWEKGRGSKHLNCAAAPDAPSTVREPRLEAAEKARADVEAVLAPLTCTETFPQSVFVEAEPREFFAKLGRDEHVNRSRLASGEVVYVRTLSGGDFRQFLYASRDTVERGWREIADRQERGTTPEQSREWLARNKGCSGADFHAYNATRDAKKVAS